MHIDQYLVFENCTFEIIAPCPRGQWFKSVAIIAKNTICLFKLFGYLFPLILTLRSIPMSSPYIIIIVLDFVTYLRQSLSYWRSWWACCTLTRYSFLPSAAISAKEYYRHSMCPSVCPAVCLSLHPEWHHHSNSLRISAISLKFVGMMLSTMKVGVEGWG